MFSVAILTLSLQGANLEYGLSESQQAAVVTWTNYILETLEPALVIASAGFYDDEQTVSFAHLSIAPNPVGQEGKLQSCHCPSLQSALATP